MLEELLYLIKELNIFYVTNHLSGISYSLTLNSTHSSISLDKPDTLTLTYVAQGTRSREGHKVYQITHQPTVIKIKTIFLEILKFKEFRGFNYYNNHLNILVVHHGVHNNLQLRVSYKFNSKLELYQYMDRVEDTPLYLNYVKNYN